LTKINYFIAEFNQLLREWDDEEANSNEDSGPFLKIESVVSLNPEAMGTEDVSSCLVFLFSALCCAVLIATVHFKLISSLCSCVVVLKTLFKRIQYFPMSGYNIHEWA
jgi:hypothetical protein